MNDLIPVEVICHSGYKADEYPKYFYWDTIRFEIEEILDRWYQGDKSPEYPVANYFKVRDVNGKIFILKHETGPDKWFLWIKAESISL